MSAEPFAARPSRLGVLTLAALTVVSLLLMVPGAAAGPGDLDGSFNGNGLVSRDWGGTDEVRGIAVQPDGKVVAAGLTSVVVNNEVLFRFALARFLADGSPDDGFGNRGLVITDINGGDSTANAVAVMADGRIVVAGSTGADPFEVALARYTPDGQLDGSFGQGGIVTDSWSDGSDQARAVAVTESGRVVVAGLANRRRVVARYTPEGARDGGFGSDGLALGVTLPGGAPVPAMALDVRGNDTTVLLYAVSGSIRSTWQAPAEPGSSLTPLGEDVSLAGGLDRVNAVIVGSGGMILVAGVREGRFAVAAHQFNGALIEVFAGGVAITDFRTETQAANAITLQPDGRVVAAGQAAYDAALARYDGIPGPTGPQPTPPPPTPEQPIVTRAPTPPPTATPEATTPATAVPTRTPPAASSQPERGAVLLSEDFSDPSSSQISLTSSDPSRFRRVITGGELQAQQFANSSTRFDLIAVPGDFTNATMAIEARLVGDPNQRAYYIACRSSTRGHYRAVIEPAARTISITMLLNGTFQNLLPATTANALRTGNETNRFELTCSGSLIQLRVNGLVAAQVQNTELSLGQFFFGVGIARTGLTVTAEARFDNLVITQE